MTNQRVKLDPLVNQLVRFKLHEIAGLKEGTIRSFDEYGYWIESGSLAEYLRKTSPGGDAASEISLLNTSAFTGFRRHNGENTRSFRMPGKPGMSQDGGFS